MAKIVKTVVDANLRTRIFNDLFNSSDPEQIISDHPHDVVDLEYVKVNDRQYGIILVDDNGVERYCRVGVIVAEEREDMTARELMQAEINAYNEKQAAKAEKAKAKADKIERDKARREAKTKEKEEV